MTNPPTAHVPASTSPITSALVSATGGDEPPSPAATDTGVAPSVHSRVSGHQPATTGTAVGANSNAGHAVGGTEVTAARLLARLEEDNSRPGIFARWRAWVNNPRPRTETETEQANPT